MVFVDYFSQPIAYDPATDDLVVDALFTVHAVDDVALSAPLAITDPTSGSAIAELRSSRVGVLPDFRAPGDPAQVILKSGPFTTKLTSTFGAVLAAGLDPDTVAAATSAAAQAAASALAAQEAAESINGTNVTIGPVPPNTGFWVDAPLPTVAATPPTFLDPSGTANDTYTVPTTAHITYRVGGVVAAAGTFPATGTIVITAEAASGYALTGPSTWSHTFSTATDPTPVTPTAPTFNDDTDTYVIPDMTGVDYRISGAIVAAGTYTVSAPASISITATARAGYTLTGTSSWSFSFTAPASMWTPNGATVLTSDSFTGSGNAESRPTDLTWGGTAVTPTTSVAGAFTVDGEALDTTAVGRLRYAATGSGRLYFGVKIASVPVPAGGFDVRYGLPASGGTSTGVKIISVSGGLNRARLIVSGTQQGADHPIALGDQVGLLLDGTTVQLYINGALAETATTAVAANDTHGFVAFGAAADVISDLIIAALA